MGQGTSSDAATVFGELADALDALRFVVPGGDWDVAESERRRLLDVIRSYLLPRLEDKAAPVVAVVAGPSGSGKSTIVNSLAQDEIGAPGAVRPATIRPALWAHPGHDVMSEASFLPRFQAATGGAVDLAVSDDDLVANVVVVDTPPLDLGDEGGREAAYVAATMADLAIFVTTQRRYADADSWHFLHFCQRRGLPVLFVVNRLSADSRAGLILDDFARRLHTAGLLTTPDDTLLFAVYDEPETEWHGGLRPGGVAQLRKELGELADPGFRDTLVREATQASGRAVVRGLTSVVPPARSQLGIVADLKARVTGAYEEQARTIEADLASGAFAELADHHLWAQAATDLTGIVTRRSGLASQQVAESWSGTPHGAALLAAGGQSLWRHGHDAITSVFEQLVKWGDDVAELAVEFTRRGRLSRRKSARVQRALWPAVLDADRSVPRIVRRTYRRVAGQLTESARRRLLDVVASALETDAERFAAFVPLLDGEAVDRLVALGQRTEALLDRGSLEQSDRDTGDA